jgi:site-specific DNA-methyltransferase (adenine-specific)
MDCLEAMSKMEDNAYDLAIVDPPYRDSNDFTKDMRSNDFRFAKNGTLGKKPNYDYFKELFRVSKEQIIWGANNFSENIPNYKGFVIYKKKTISENFTMSMCEIASISENLGTIAKWIEIAPQNPNRIHPTQKPVKLYEWLLMNYAKEGDKILDTHLGSGSSAIAAHNLGYDFTGYELDEEYFNATKKRLDNHTAQLRII